MLTKDIIDKIPSKTHTSGGESEDGEACAALLAFASADEEQKQSKSSKEVTQGKTKASARGRKRRRDSSSGADAQSFAESLPIQKIASIMKRALPRGAFISKEAKQAVQACVYEFVCFLTSEACDRQPAGEHSVSQRIDSEDILQAFIHLGFDKYSEACQSFIDRYRRHIKQSASSQNQPTSRRKAHKIHEMVGRESSQATSCVPTETPASSEPVPSEKIAEKSNLSTASVSSPSTVSSIPKFNPPQSPNVHALKSLRAASIEVASSLVYAWSRPIVESALFLAGSPSTAACTPSSVPTPFPSPMMSPAMSPMFMTHLGLSLASSSLQNMSPMASVHGSRLPSGAQQFRPHVIQPQSSAFRGRSMQDHRSQVLEQQASSLSGRPLNETNAEAIRPRTTLATLLTSSKSCPRSPLANSVASNSDVDHRETVSSSGCADAATAGSSAHQSSHSAVKQSAASGDSAREADSESNQQPCPLPLAPIQAS